MLSGCAACQRLWREYAVATAYHIPLESRIRQAAIHRDFARIAELEPRVEAALAARLEARESIRRHEAAAHANRTGEAAARS